jgi:hypothetical protein
MRRLLAILAVLGILGAFPVNLRAQANLPYNQNSQTVQGPDGSGQLGWPIATVPATGALPWPVSVVNFLANVCVTQCTSPWITGFGGVAQPTVPSNGFRSIVNSTTTPLLAGQTFTGQYESVQDYSSMEIYVDAGPAAASSANNGVVLEWSFDGVNTDFRDRFNLLTNQTQRVFETPIRAYPFVRYTFTNGATNQSFFKSGLAFRRFAHSAISFPFVFVPNGGTNVGQWIPAPQNGNLGLIPAASYTTVQSSVTYRGAIELNANYKYASFSLNVTSVPVTPGTGGLDLSIIEQDINGFNIMVNAAAATPIRATGVYRWALGPGLGSGSGLGPNIRQTISLPLTSAWFAKVVPSDAQAYVYSLTVDLTQ